MPVWNSTASRHEGAGRAVCSQKLLGGRRRGERVRPALREVDGDFEAVSGIQDLAGYSLADESDDRPVIPHLGDRIYTSRNHVGGG